MRAPMLLSFVLLVSSTLAIPIDDLSDLGSKIFEFHDTEPFFSNVCTSSNCKLPDCRCSGTDIPGGLKPSDTPQMVVLTFQNGIRKEDLSKYQSLFTTKNPNGCSTTGTFYAAHEYTDYFTVQTLRSNRHEIGVNGIDSSHYQDWWKSASAQDWASEMGGQKEILSLMANIPSDEISGERAPYLQMGGDNQILAMRKAKISYDATRVSVKFSNPPKLLWPYTYDFNSTQDCVVPPCPTQSAKGIWQVPLLALTDQSGYPCATLDACNATTAFEVYSLLRRAIFLHYVSNRAPLILTLSARWVGDQKKMIGTMMFLNMLQNAPEVYVVSADRMLAWVKKPTKLSQLSTFAPFKCDKPAPYACTASEALTCRYDEARRLVTEEGPGIKYRTTTCLRKCPSCYPWVNDTKGTRC